MADRQAKIAADFRQVSRELTVAGTDDGQDVHTRNTCPCLQVRCAHKPEPNDGYVHAGTRRAMMSVMSSDWGAPAVNSATDALTAARMALADFVRCFATTSP